MQSRKKELVLFMIFIAIFILMAVLSPRFLSTYNLQTMAFQLPEFGLIALGMMIAILTGGINLSITSGAALSGIAAAFMLSANQGTEAGIWLIITAAVGVIMLVSVVLGTLNGTIIAYVGAAPCWLPWEARSSMKDQPVADKGRCRIQFPRSLLLVRECQYWPYSCADGHFCHRRSVYVLSLRKDSLGDQGVHGGKQPHGSGVFGD